MKRKVNSGKRRARRSSFADIVEAVRSENGQRLGERARVANQLAKIAPSARSRAVAYAVKTAALEQGLRCGRFEFLRDERGRDHLAVVRTEGHGMLHLCVDRLSRDILDRPEVQLYLRGAAA